MNNRFMRVGAIAKKQVNKVLVRNAGFCGKAFKIINSIFLDADRDLLLQHRGIGVSLRF